MKRLFSFVLIFILGLSGAASACDMHGGVSTRGAERHDDEAKPWAFDFLFEQQNWETMDAADAHRLHHQGHHVHVKTHEEFYNFAFAADPNEVLSLTAELPYVVRNFIEIHEHDRLGEKDEASGLGDLEVNAIARFLRKEHGWLGAVAGVKFPTGSTTEVNPDGERIEAELQPGSGSHDYTAGVAFEHDLQPMHLHGDVLYVFKTEGDQDFEFGDHFAVHLSADHAVNEWLIIGVDLSLEIEGKDSTAGVKSPDSGGTTVLVGPFVNLAAHENVAFFGNFLVPAYQDLGGVHQELDFVWSAGCKISW